MIESKHAAAPNVDSGEVEKFTSRAADWWDPHGPFRTLHEINPLRLGYVRGRVVLRGARVLDVGCGGGLFAEAVAAEGGEVVGIDMGPSNVGVARTHASESGFAIRYECIDAAAFAAQRPGEFDVVTCFELLEHVPDPAAIVSACALALRPGGSAFFSTINRNPKSFLLAIVAAEHLLRMVPRGTHEYLKLVRPSELAAWCRRAGLNVVDLSGLHFNPVFAEYALGGNVDVNYFAHAVKGAR
ncbi:MAG TPA: bifunctional 2-polyprenyl-6-hydroxyphenol methylase/3-demethylubiquinol 3-O-methyltransferase UbiG [Gammaproteobacteria bacterium]|nr:bifunctional 2-polyprenyl-6-hydroxyphenol methylase/3-demethylubiquinol 3-O-methyltransferase UbiG [Gammaproteobacteria bacterium]